MGVYVAQGCSVKNRTSILASLLRETDPWILLTKLQLPHVSKAKAIGRICGPFSFGASNFRLNPCPECCNPL